MFEDDVEEDVEVNVCNRCGDEHDDHPGMPESGRYAGQCLCPDCYDDEIAAP